jgi:Fur family transcriptional regulator, ferric uptake regulator
MSKRPTRQQQAVVHALGSAAGFRTAQELHDELRKTGEKVGLTTVYRTLQSLAGAGDVDVLQSSEGEAMYRRCSRGTHHHHLVCRSCGHSIEIENAVIEQWAADTARRHGFTSVTHTAEVYGLCNSCSDS